MPATANATRYFNAEFPTSEDDVLREQVIADLAGVGVTPVFYNQVKIPQNSRELLDIISMQFSVGENIIIFGFSGTGKTQMVQQAAALNGYDIIDMSAVTKLPEDFSGIPLTLESDLSDDEYAKHVRHRLENEKRDAEVDTRYEAAKTRYTNPKLIKSHLRDDVSVTVTDDEVADAIQKEKYGPMRKRLHQTTSAPDWVFQLIDNWVYNGKKTVLFFDELNQANRDTMDALFDLVLAKRYGNEERYSFADAAIFAAAGNFASENDAIQPLPKPLLSRFQCIVYYPGDWTGSLQWMKDSYLEEANRYPHLAEFLSDSSVSIDAWSNSFSSPRDIEVLLKRFAFYEKESQKGNTALLDRIRNLRLAGLTDNMPETLKAAALRFLGAIGVPFAQGTSATSRRATSPSALNMKQRQSREFSAAFVAFMGQLSYVFNATRYYKTNNADVVNFILAVLKACKYLVKDDLEKVSAPDGRTVLQVYREAGGDEAALNKIILDNQNSL